MYVPKPKVIIRPLQKQDYFSPSGEAVPSDSLIWTYGQGTTVQYQYATLDEICWHIKKKADKFLVRRRIYLQFELRESVRVEGQNKSRSRALKGVTFRQGDESVPRGFYRAVLDKLESFGLSRAEQQAAMQQVRTHVEAALTAHRG